MVGAVSIECLPKQADNDVMRGVGGRSQWMDAGGWGRQVRLVTSDRAQAQQTGPVDETGGECQQTECMSGNSGLC